MEPSINNETASLINDAQRRSLSVSLQLLEEELFFIQLLADHGTHHGHLLSMEIDVNAEQRRRLHQEIKKVLLHIQHLKEAFELETKSEKLSKRVMSVESYYWSVLCDQKSGKLKRYGDISEGLPGILDPTLDQIMGVLRKMVDAITENSDGAGRPDKGNTNGTSS